MSGPEDEIVGAGHISDMSTVSLQWKDTSDTAGFNISATDRVRYVGLSCGRKGKRHGSGVKSKEVLKMEGKKNSQETESFTSSKHLTSITFIMFTS